uniref:Contactin associated protein like 3 n=1 Tax=Oryzias sinensis TaxID=183150 RepID=A0A8C7X7R4_9TELE
TAYLLLFSDTGHNWIQHRQEDSLGAFQGNSNADFVVQYKLEQPVIARYLRLTPLDWNPTGRIGLRMEIYGCEYTSEVVSFDGSSSLIYRLSLRPSWMSTEVISMNFKTLKNSGTLLHAKGPGDHSLNLVLEKGKLSFSGGQLLVSLGSLLDDQHWHHVELEKFNADLNITVDKNTQQVHLPAELIILYCFFCNYFSFFFPFPLPQGNVTFSCSEPVSVSVTFTDLHSFLQLPGLPFWPSEVLSIMLQFRTWNKAGLLLSFVLPQQGGMVFLYLSDARLRLQISKANKTLLELRMNDGQWHSVELTSKRDHLSIMVDKDEGATAQTTITLPLTSNSQLFFGGCAQDSHLVCTNPFRVFQGCMRLLTLDGNPVDLIKVQQRVLGNYSHLKTDTCGIIDRCTPSHCEHGSKCIQTWSTFHCNCSNSGYRGATCHSSSYERSCEMYKYKGNTSGHYYIDVDGSGPIKPQTVYCNMTGMTQMTRILSSSEKNQHFAHFNYSSADDQLAAIISQSDHCEQELSYHCRRSRLLTSIDGAPLSWWMGGPGPGRVQTYWGGALPDSHQCACARLGKCLDSRFACNCDADHDQWTDDSGLITQKENLPVRSLVLGDIQRSGSEGAYRVGILRCRGDKNFWNAAFFDKETSYLHFPTFHGELNVDISFLFKTTSSSGVFLENLGIKDFIRIELASSSEVVFFFDVGNGPVEVRVKTSLPLNDDRWHTVRAERNVKEASLRVDNFPAETQDAPADGLIHLQLNSPLFVGGTASRQRGFLGCIRSLQLNGVTLDLEERAKITPGVHSGCPGHCSSYGTLCQNQGRCVEHNRGFSCDCSPSAYTGISIHSHVTRPNSLQTEYFKTESSKIVEIKSLQDIEYHLKMKKKSLLKV